MSDRKIHATLARKEEVSNATPARFIAIRNAAESLSLRNVDAAVCEVLNEALARLVQTLYEGQADDLYNVDRTTGRVLIPLPFGRNGHKRWGMYLTEANILRLIVFGWQQEDKPLLAYDASRRAWFVNLRHYANIHLAKQWLGKHQVTVTIFRAARGRRKSPGGT